MTYAFTIDVPAPMDRYDIVHAEVTRRAGDHVDGMLVHFARSTATGFQVVEIWASKEQCDRFNDQVVGPVMAELAAGQPVATGEPVMLEFQPHGLLVAGREAAAGPMA